MTFLLDQGHSGYIKAPKYSAPVAMRWGLDQGSALNTGAIGGLLGGPRVKEERY